MLQGAPTDSKKPRNPPVNFKPLTILSAGKAIHPRIASMATISSAVGTRRAHKTRFSFGTSHPSRLAISATENNRASRVARHNRAGSMTVWLSRDLFRLTGLPSRTRTRARPSTTRRILGSSRVSAPRSVPHKPARSQAPARARVRTRQGPRTSP